MKGRYLYLALDHKHAGVVTCVADSPTELARLRKDLPRHRQSNGGAVGRRH